MPEESTRAKRGRKLPRACQVAPPKLRSRPSEASIKLTETVIHVEWHGHPTDLFVSFGGLGQDYRVVVKEIVEEGQSFDEMNCPGAVDIHQLPFAR